ncbi:N-acetyltransferase [Cohnella sp. AR92]|uniref:GNAT family N-acetyltransferase n=1 Tax=Cohnella sp. AR92 TaxID=648716 RepID=UPI000F8F5B82|nr:GNAT family N-acetyltransferase [Cohnella sp. AR92]RUS42078.1 GNAT family N-acetyltransferase [Cohnella sp. AR92]
MRIELLRLSDRDIAEEVWGLQHAAYRVEAQIIGVSDLPPLHDTVERIQASEDTVWGAWDEADSLVGAIAIEESEKDNTIGKLMVHPDSFRQGVGSKLLNHALGAYPSHIGWLVTAEVRNKPAIALYEKAGFRAGETLKPRSDITMILMRLEAGSRP